MAESILSLLDKKEIWEKFLQYKIERKHLSAKELEFWEEFVQKEAYRPVTSQLTQSSYSFDYPVKISVNKSGTRKKRVVYIFSDTESMILKAMSYLLYRYDSSLSESCYSFRKNRSAKDAITKIMEIPDLDNKYCLKVDVHNYFNSIPVDGLIQVLSETINDDPALLCFLENLLRANRAYEDNKLIEEERGAMAGTPISPFFANIYLLSLDKMFASKKVPYFRYSDDILLFADSKDALNACQEELTAHIYEKGLTLNPDKVQIYAPKEGFDFLGFHYQDGKIDLSRISKEKMKHKLRRKAHYLYRIRRLKKQNYETTARTFIRTFNRKFYEEEGEDRFTWSRWFFPVLTSVEGLHELDLYFQTYIRYLYSGRHYKGNYRITYERMKELGYRSLVHEYYASKNLSFDRKCTMMDGEFKSEDEI